MRACVPSIFVGNGARAGNGLEGEENTAAVCGSVKHDGQVGVVLPRQGRHAVGDRIQGAMGRPDVDAGALERCGGVREEAERVGAVSLRDGALAPLEVRLVRQAGHEEGNGEERGLPAAHRREAAAKAQAFARPLGDDGVEDEDAGQDQTGQQEEVDVLEPVDHRRIAGGGGKKWRGGAGSRRRALFFSPPMAPRRAVAVLAAVLALCRAGNAGDGPQRRTFRVVFDSPEPLGMELDTRLVVSSFAPPDAAQAEGAMSLAQGAGIVVGDRLLAVNGEPVNDLAAATRLLDPAAAARRELTFSTSPHRDGPSPAAPGPSADALDGAGGHVELLNATARLGRLPARPAEFSAPGSCNALRVVAADPADGCGEPRNELELRGALVIVDRGMCTFQDKALNMQWAGAGAVAIVDPGNGPLPRMPAKDSEAATVSVPIVAVSAATGARLRRAAQGADGVVFAQLPFAAAPCTDAQLAATTAVVSLPTGRGELQRVGIAPNGTVFPPQGAVVEAGKGQDVAAAATEEEGEREHEPLAAGGGLYVSAPAAATRTSRAVAEVAATCRVRRPLPLSWRESLPAFQRRAAEGGKGADASFVAGAGAAQAVPQVPVQRSLMEMEFLRARFGGPLPDRADLALAVAVPPDACADLTNLDEVEGAAVLVARGTCPLADKARRAQAAGAALVVFVNDREGLEAPRSAGSAADRADLALPAVMVSQEAGGWLRDIVRAAEREAVAEAARVAADMARAREQAGVAGVEEGEGEEEQRERDRADVLVATQAEFAPRVTVFGDSAIAEAWDGLTQLQQYEAWPVDGKERHDMYRRLARRHHPDKGGSAERFALLQSAFKTADHFLKQRAAQAAPQ